MAKKSKRQPDDLGEFGAKENPVPIVNSFDWFAGASAQVEIAASKDVNYNIFYALPRRAAIRPPTIIPGFTPIDIKAIDDQLEEVKAFLGKTDESRSVPETPPANPGAIPPDAPDRLEDFGRMLFNKVLPWPVRNALRGEECFLEIGVDEKLDRFPLELMHDGKEYLCLRHRIGRYIVSSQQTQPPANPRKSSLSALVVAVPNPRFIVDSLDDQAKKKFQHTLERVSHEATAIVNLLRSVGCEVVAVEGAKATLQEITRLLCTDRAFDIIHFCGHGWFDNSESINSGLLLHDRLMSTNDIRGFVPNAKPVFCFVNACDSANAGTAHRFNVFGGIGEAFLSSGSYLLASRAKVGDKSAAAFAVKFYQTLLKDGKSFGEAVLEGRRACKEVEGSAFDWAAYIFYGDPRFGFSKPASPRTSSRRKPRPSADPLD